MIGRHTKLPVVPRFPQVRLDFSALADATKRYDGLSAQLAKFKHDALKRVTFVEAYQGGSIPAGKRSLLLRAEIGLPDRTLADEDIASFQKSFRQFLESSGLELRA